MAETTLDARVAFIQRQLHAVNLSLQQAVGRGDTAAIASLKTLYKKLQADAEQLKADAHASDAPGAFMMQLDALSDEFIKTGRAIEAATVTAVGGIASTVKYLPIILLVALVVVGLVYAGKLRKDLK